MRHCRRSDRPVRAFDRNSRADYPPHPLRTTFNPPAEGAAGGKRRVEGVQARSERRSPGGAGSGAAAASAAMEEAEMEAELAAWGEAPDDLGLDSL